MADGLSPAKIMFGYTVAEKDTVDFLSDAFFRNSPYAEERKQTRKRIFETQRIAGDRQEARPPGAGRSDARRFLP